MKKVLTKDIFLTKKRPSIKMVFLLKINFNYF